MNDKVKEVPMGDDVFYIHRFNAFKAMRVLGDVQKVILPVIGGAMKGLGSASPDADTTDMTVVAGAAQEIFMTLPERLDGERLESLARTLIMGENVAVSIGGNSRQSWLNESLVNQVFVGRSFDMLALMWHVFNHNYMDFSMLSSVPAGVQGALAELKRKFQEKLQMNSVD